MHGDVLLIVLVLVFGCAAFFFGILYALGRAVAWVGRGVWGVCRPGSPPVGPRGLGVRFCPRTECRRVERRRDARYCSQCGQRLPE